MGEEAGNQGREGRGGGGQARSSGSTRTEENVWPRVTAVLVATGTLALWPSPFHVILQERHPASLGATDPVHRGTDLEMT